MNPGSSHPGRPALFLVAGLLSLLAACSKSSAPASTPAAAAAAATAPLPVTVLEVQPQTIPSSLEVVAQTEGARETEVRARVGGILLRRLYQEGERVKAGQPLFQIDRSAYEIALAEARARAEQAATDVARLEELLASQAVSRKSYGDALTAAAIARAALRQAELNLSWTTVTAPVAGMTGRAVKSEGSLITTGDESLLTSIYQVDPMWVRFSLAESDVARLPGGRLSEASIQGVELLMPDGSVYPGRGRLNFVASTIDPTLGTRQLRAEFDNAKGELLPGQFVRVRLQTGERQGVFLVPQVAVVQTDQGRVVMLADAEGKVAPRPVQTGEWRGRDWVILGGLAAGDRVIVDNLMKLRAGMAVAPQPAIAPQPGAPPGAAAEAGGKTSRAPSAAGRG